MFRTDTGLALFVIVLYCILVAGKQIVQIFPGCGTVQEYHKHQGAKQFSYLLFQLSVFATGFYKSAAKI